jgi:hypothetical protein
MTIRAVTLGLLGAIIICGFTYFNDAVMHQTYLIGNNMPISIYGSLFIFIVVINPLLFFLRKRWALTGAELAVIFTLTLAVACIPGSGLMRTFTTTLMLPQRIEKVTPAWQQPTAPNPWRKGSITQQLPAKMLADTHKNEDRSLTGFVQGLSVGNKNITMKEVPWYAWTRTLTFWLPLIFAFLLALFGLSLAVHRQWADHEQLPYPIAKFAGYLLPKAGSILPTLLKSRPFWIVTGGVFLFHLTNYLNIWDPRFLAIPRYMDLQSQKNLFPLIITGGGIWWFWKPTVYFSVIAVGYLLATDVSLSLSMGPVIWVVVNGILVNYGVSVGSSGAQDYSIIGTISFGAYFGLLLVLLYTGRHYYVQLLRRACFLHTNEKLSPEAVWGTRLFGVAGVICVVYMSVLSKLDWQMSVLYLAIAVMLFLVMSRILAETGAFFIQASFTPMTVFIGLFGAGAIGPQALLLLMMFSTVMLVDPREAFMPFISNSLKLLDTQKVPIRKISIWVIVSLIVGFAVAIPTTLYWQYNKGANMSDGWASKDVPSMPFDSAIKFELNLANQNRLAAASHISGWAHFRHITPKPEFMLVFVIGVGLVLLFSAARLHFTKWPLHPVLFLIWTTYPAYCFAFSFFLGWVVKSLVTKYGGGGAYRSLMPMILGLIAGDMLAGVTATIVGLIYFLVTHQPPKQFAIMPG